MGATDRPGRDPSRVHDATEATPLMAAYFLGALRDQSSRASVFQRQMRWQRLRLALATEEALVAEQHLLEHPATRMTDVTTTAELPAPRQAAAG